MPEQNNASAGAGSAGNGNGSGSSGEAIDLSQYIPKGTYDELQSKLGEQGSELGEFRKFYQEITPLLEKLDKYPDLVEAIVADKFNDKLAKAVLDGKVKIEEVVQVQKAQEEVKKDMG